MPSDPPPPFELPPPGPPSTGRGWSTGLPCHVHLVGAGGAGLSGAGLHLLAQGHAISGQDLAPSDFATDLERAGARVSIGASEAAALPAGAQVLVHSAAVPEDDPQLVEARRRGLPTLLYAELLARIAPPERTLAVAGTHGKTTTSWMVFHALRGAGGAAPGALVGGRHRGLERGAVEPGEDGFVVLEACEYGRTFLRLAPAGAIVTNVEPDHLDVYGTLAAVEEAFAAFAARVDPAGTLVLGAEVPACVETAARCRVLRLGRELRLADLRLERGRARARLAGPGFDTDLSLSVPGDFNAENAALALGLALAMHPAGDAARAAADLATFEGAARRFEPWGGSAGEEVLVVHDYAHHPTEVRATLAAARAAFPERRLVVLFQPHQASRTAHFLEDFVESLLAADVTLAVEVYGARRQIDAHAAGSAELVAGLERRGARARLVGGPRSCVEPAAEEVRSGDLLLVLGAGDIDTVREPLLAALARRFADGGALSSRG